MVNKTFIVIILTIVLLGIIIYFCTNCSREHFQNENENNNEINIPGRYFADLDNDGTYDTLTSNITKYREFDKDGSRIKMFKFDGEKSYIHITKLPDPKANVSMLLLLDARKGGKQTLINTHNYTIEYELNENKITIVYNFGRNAIPIPVPAINDTSLFYNLVLNFNSDNTISIGFGLDDNLTTYTSEENISGSFVDEDNIMYIGASEGEAPFYQGYIGKIKITSDRFDIPEPTTTVAETTAAETTAAETTAVETTAAETIEEEEKEKCEVVQTAAAEETGFIIRRGNSTDYTNGFLGERTSNNELISFPGIGTNVRMYKFNDESAFEIENLSSKNLTLYFAIQFAQLDYDENIIDGSDFSVKVESGNLTLDVKGTKKVMAIQTRKVYFVVLMLDSRESNITLRMDMFQETLDYSRINNINSVKIGGNKQLNTHFTGRIGHFIIKTTPYSFESICDSSRLCQIVEENCIDYTDENKCNNSTNKGGTKCKYNVVCVPKVNSASARDKCAEHSTGVACSNDDSCMVDEDLSMCRDVQPVDVVEDVSVPTYLAIPTTTSTQDVSRPPPRNCSFNAEGKTREACVDRCSNEFRARQINEDCNPAVCRILCDKCTSPNCLWKSEESVKEVREPMVPVAPKIKVYAGDSQVKLLWVAPYSISDIEKYTCVIEGGDMGKETRIEFPVDTSCSLCEHIIGSMKNGLNYNIFIIASNKEGDSLPSNVVSIMPMVGKQLPDTGKKHDMEMNQLDDSLQEYKRVIDSGDYSELKKLVNIEDENADYYELLDLLVSDKKNKRILNEKMKFEIVS